MTHSSAGYGWRKWWSRRAAGRWCRPGRSRPCIRTSCCLCRRAVRGDAATAEAVAPKSLCSQMDVALPYARLAQMTPHASSFAKGYCRQIRQAAHMSPTRHVAACLSWNDSPLGGIARQTMRPAVSREKMRPFRSSPACADYAQAYRRPARLAVLTLRAWPALFPLLSCASPVPCSSPPCRAGSRPCHGSRCRPDH